MTTSKSIVLKYNMKKLLTNLILFIAKIVNKRIKRILSDKKIGFGRKASNTREIKSLENNLNFEATKNITSTPKIAIEKSPIVVKPNVATPSKIASKLTIANKPKIVDKSSVVTSKISSKPKMATKKILIIINIKIV